MIDFLYGVMALTAFQLLPILFYIYGYLDQQTYVSFIHKNSFYDNSEELVLVYSYYTFILFTTCIFLISMCISFILLSFMKRVSRCQIQCYRPYFPYHCMVCVVPYVVRYTYITAYISDDIMAGMDWERLFLVLFSIFRFVLSFFLLTLQKYKLWRWILYMIMTVIHLLVFTYFFYLMWNICVSWLNSIKKSKGEFLTEWSYVYSEQLDEFNVSKLNTHIKNFRLDQMLFMRTGHKSYLTQDLLSLQLKDRCETMRPYQREIYTVGIGESVKLPCSATVHTKAAITVLWSLNDSYPYSNFITKRRNSSNTFITELDIDFIENSDFGDITCSFRLYEHFGEKLFFQHRMASSFIKSSEFLIAQYSVIKYSGREFYIYATPGGAIDIRWKRMSFNSDIEDITQYYYVNGVQFNRPKDSPLFCSSLSHLYIIFGQAMDWFDVPYLSESSHILYKYFKVFETRFTECAGYNVFGIHTVVYLRRVYDSKSRSFILREVQHPDTIYVLPDTAYFYKMDNATKARKKEIIQNLQTLDLDYQWFDNRDTCILIARIVGELIIFLTLLLLLAFFLDKCFNWYGKFIIQPIREMVLGQPFDFTSGKCGPSVCCYVLCGDADRNSVYHELVIPLRKNDVTTGFTFEESHINRSGKSVFEIQCEILKQCKHLIFYVTTSYLKEERFVDIQLETVLQCIKMGFISSNKVLIIIADSCDLPDKIRYNLPEAAANIHNWVSITKQDTRISRIVKWMNNKRKDIQKSDTPLSTLFFG